MPHLNYLEPCKRNYKQFFWKWIAQYAVAVTWRNHPPNKSQVVIIGCFVCFLLHISSQWYSVGRQISLGDHMTGEKLFLPCPDTISRLVAGVGAANQLILFRPRWVKAGRRRPAETSLGFRRQPASQAVQVSDLRIPFTKLWQKQMRRLRRSG